jgi:hypothetical protein
VSDAGDYCRQVEAYLTRVNGGHLVRVVGPGFAMVRQWAEEGIPLSAVFRGIDQKAERHRRGTSRRPLRIEFCEADVRQVYDDWRRAVGVPVATGVTADAEVAAGDRGSGSARRSASKDLARAMERLVAVTGRLDLSDALRDEAAAVLDALAAMRDALRTTRGEARAAVLAPLASLDRRLMSAGLQAMPADALATVTREAEADLAPFRDRLQAGAWREALTATVERGVRAHLGLPDLTGIGD